MNYLVAWQGTTTESLLISGTSTVVRVKPISCIDDLAELTTNIKEDAQSVREVEFANFIILAFSKFEDP